MHALQGVCTLEVTYGQVSSFLLAARRLLALHDAVNWAAVRTLPPYHPPQAGVYPLPRHSLRIRRSGEGENHYRGWASTNFVSDLGIPRFLAD